MRVNIGFELEIDLKEYGINFEEMEREIINSLKREFGTDLKSVDIQDQEGDQ